MKVHLIFRDAPITLSVGAAIYFTSKFAGHVASFVDSDGVKYEVPAYQIVRVEP